MIRDPQDERTVAKFVQDVCFHRDWKLKFQVTTSEDVQDDPDAEPDERFTFEGFAEYFEETMRSRDAEVSAISYSSTERCRIVQRNISCTGM